MAVDRTTQDLAVAVQLHRAGKLDEAAKRYANLRLRAPRFLTSSSKRSGLDRAHLVQDRVAESGARLPSINQPCPPHGNARGAHATSFSP